MPTEEDVLLAGLPSSTGLSDDALAQPQDSNDERLSLGCFLIFVVRSLSFTTMCRTMGSGVFLLRLSLPLSCTADVPGRLYF